MTAPSFDVMDEINGYPIWSSPTIIHCYAGFGRTGTILFLFWFRWTILNKMFEVLEPSPFTNFQIGYEALTTPFLKCRLNNNYTQSGEMYSRILLQFYKCISVGYLNANFTRGSTFNKDKIVDEFFKIEKLTSANLFVARINYVLLYVALFLNAQTDRTYLGIPRDKITRIYLYPLHTNYPPGKSVFDENLIFQTPILTDIHTYIANNNFGFKPHNIPYTSSSSSP